MKYCSLILIASALCTACPSPDDAANDAGLAPVDGGGQSGRDAGVGPDAGAGGDGDAGGDAGRPEAMEVEPNDGTTPNEVNALALGTAMLGAIGSPVDADIFLLPTSGATLYRASLDAAPGSPLDAHLTVLDDGRGADGAGADYTQLSPTGVGADASLTFFAMNESPGEGHLIVVRDARNVAGGSEGGADFTYTLVVDAVDVSAIEPVTLPHTNTYTLDHGGDALVLQFEANEGDEALFTFSTEGEMDGRLFVVAEQTGAWIARNDDSGADNANPRIDAPLFAQGTMYLVVDNINPDASDLSFTLSLTIGP